MVSDKCPYRWLSLDERQIKDLLEKLNKSDFSIVLKEEQFEDHGDVGQFFGPYLRQVLIESE